MKYLQTITDHTIFSNPEFKDHGEYTKRTTVKVIVRNEKGYVGLITNDIHKLYTLPGGGAESEDLETEVNRESIEEINCDLLNIQELVRVKELRNRDAKEYETVCFVADVNQYYTNDTRTEEEKKNNLRVEWISEDEVSNIFKKQISLLENGEIAFYNTAFNIYRDNEFFKEYLKINKE